MLLKPGDRVSFLNEKRNGIVKKILNNKMVVVTIDDGFDIPVLEHDLVKAKPFEETANTASNQQSEPVCAGEERFPERVDLIIYGDDNDKLKRGIYLSFIPENPDNILSSGFGVYLVNNYSHSLLFTYALKKEEHFACTDFDRVDEDSALLLDTIDMTDIEKWKNIQFQFLFYKQGVAFLKPPLVQEIQIKPTRFYKENNFILYSVFREKCLLIPVSDKETPAPEKWDEKRWKNSVIEKPAGIKVVGHLKDFLKAEPVPEKHVKENRIAEVDLHIEELTDDYYGKENYELLSIQLNYFSKMMESALAGKFRKIIFIHGVGNGKLKQEITEKLVKDYSGIKFNDASPLLYGRGATEVILE